MFIFIRLFWESIRFATDALRQNLLRTILSLLGVTVGIFAIIAVLTIVDALNVSIKNSLAFLGDKVMYVQKFPFAFNEPNYPWWKYMRRPAPKYEEYEFLERTLTQASAVSVFDVRGNQSVRYRSNSLRAAVMGASQFHNFVSDIKVADGRYFSPQESKSGRNVVIIGHTVAKELFDTSDPIGKEIKIRDIKFLVIGVMQRQGDNFLPTPSNDDLCIIPFLSFSRLFASRSRGVNPVIAVKGYEADTGLTELEGEITGLLRAYRKLKPKDEDNFALNRTEAIADVLDSIIAVLKVAGWCIGSFSILVGGFGIANIMFVSVKERTNLIGIQKSLGAKNYFILLQFLFESVFLSVLGGAAGLLLVSTLSAFSTETFQIVLTPSNMLLGLTVSSVIGVLSGIIPAYSASQLDPVEAIRSK